MCNCIKNGQTKVVGLVQATTGTPSTTQQTYYVDVLHSLCKERKFCVTSIFSPSANIIYNVTNIQSIGNNIYACDIQISGTCTYVQNGCCSCPVTEGLFCSVTVPVYSATGMPTVTIAGGGSATVSASGVKDCRNIANAIEIETVMIVNSVAPAE